MPFLKDILPHRSLSIVGLDKNTGKTVCLNYLLQRLNEERIPVAVTSIGVDGEQVDSVFSTSKPEVTLYEETYFITSARHYLQRRLLSRIEAVDRDRTALGQLVTAKVLCRGKVILSGAATTEKLRQQIAQLCSMGVRLTIVDGALSRLSLASPTITDAMILATGAAVSPNLQQLISKTRFACKLINLPSVEESTSALLSNIESGVWVVDNDGEIRDTGIQSALMLSSKKEELSAEGNTIFISGAISDRILKQLTDLRSRREVRLIARDFTKLFITPEGLTEFQRHGGSIEVLQRSHLVAICLNPTSPQGYRLDSHDTCKALSEALELPVFDVKKIR